MDDTYQRLVSGAWVVHPGKKPEVTDSDIVTLAILHRWIPQLGDARFLQYVHQHGTDDFPRVLSRSQYNKRVRNLLGSLMTAFHVTIGINLWHGLPT